ncbi:MAG: hypothetical protein COV75_08805 [Candidatus Omnitrophica bacterium CG11_big_fil_rev_8_21_14_0_20_63_9]|nr:MAG: hypothetical protein COV75_08805 [Candidatus Omnitrophica bacterium CG11_big_fil_rev_8_21_14_0_20_63_9]
MASFGSIRTFLTHRSALSLEDRFLFTQQLHVLQHAGVPLLSSLEALRRQMPSSALQEILETVHHDLLEGRSFSQALARHNGMFGPVYVGMVRVGEAGGLLDDTLKHLAELLEWELDVRRRIRDAVQYPLVVLSTLAVALLLMAVFVLPRFAEMFRSFRIELPLQTRLLIGLSELLSRYGVWMTLLVIAAGTGCALWMRTDAARQRWHAWLLRVPIAGSMVLQLAMSRVARVVALLHRGGMPMLETLALAAHSVSNRAVRSALDTVRRRVASGSALAAAMRSEPLFPPVVVQMVASGEEAGRLDELLHSISAYYDQQVTYRVRRLTTSLEPLLLIVVGLGVLLMASAVFVPMWDLVQLFKHSGR